MDLHHLRRDFSLKTLSESEVQSDPLNMLQIWIDDAIATKALEPNAMLLSTVSAEGRPSSRVVLLKELKAEGLVFFTNHKSKKGKEIEINNNVAATFVWHELERQVRVEGKAVRISDEESTSYYNIRPRDSRIGAWASPQSQVISGREFIEQEVDRHITRFERQEIPRPPYWGGYIIVPTLLEFWQGRPNRLHDRIEYQLRDGQWIVQRLAP